jgi:hypothetical protein
MISERSLGATGRVVASNHHLQANWLSAHFSRSMAGWQSQCEWTLTRKTTMR